MERLPFAQAQSAASQSAIALTTTAVQSTTGTLNITSYVAPFAGSIIGIAATITTTATTGTVSVTPTVNGTASTVASLVLPIVTNKAYTGTVEASKQPFAAGDLIGVKISTQSTYAPTTSDVQVVVYVMYTGVMP